MWQQMYKGTMKPNPERSQITQKPVKRFKFKKGDSVRISSNRYTFQRDYQEKWTEEIFTIHARYLRQGISVYKLVDYDQSKAVFIRVSCS